MSVIKALKKLRLQRIFMQYMDDFYKRINAENQRRTDVALDPASKDDRNFVSSLIKSLYQIPPEIAIGTLQEVQQAAPLDDFTNCDNRAVALVKEYWPAIRRVADALLERGKLMSDEVRSLLLN